MHLHDFKDLDLNGKNILVTGGTGSFGHAFVRMVLENYTPERLIIYSRDEAKQYDMAREFDYTPVKGNTIPLRFHIGDVRDCDRLELAMHGVDCVVHAAALKHVPTAEYNPIECVNTNIHGAENVVRAALNCNVEKVIALSTDKAVNPVNLYGASKLAAEKIFVAANNLSGKRATRFSVVRYGNVLGSRGSVVPLFRSLIAKGTKILPITDPRMTRFWITLEESASFVLSAITMMSGGEIFVPKIPSMRVIDLAESFAPDISTETIGIRPGEKLHEVLVMADESRTAIDLGDRYIIEPAFTFWSREPYTMHGATPVAEGFSYSSDSNDDWLSTEQLIAMLAETDA